MKDGLSSKYSSPLRLLGITIGGIFLAEIVAMAAVYSLGPIPYYQTTLIDAGIMTALIVPVLYFYFLQPLLRHIGERQRAEDALEASHERFTKAFYSNAAALSITKLADGRYIDFNASFLRAFGYTRDEVIGHTALELNLYHDPAEHAKLVQSLRAHGSVRNYELTARVKSGELRCMEVSFDEIELDGEACLLGTLNDITERRQAENALRESEEKFRTLADWTYDWEYWMDPRGNIVYNSPSCEQMTGRRPEEFVADSNLLKSIVHPLDQPFYDEHQKWSHNESAGMSNIEFRIIARDGSVHWIDHICRPLFGVDHHWLGRRISNRDITKRKRIEEALDTERVKLRTIMDTMPDGMYIVNRRHEIEYVNPVIEREFGPPQGRKCYAYFHDRTEICPWCKNEEVFDGKTVRWEWYSQKTGKTYDLFDTPMFNSDGSVSKLELFHDITHRKQAEAELEQRNQALQALSASERKQRQLAETLRASAQALTETLDLDIVLRTLLRHIRSLVQSDTASVILLEGESLLAVRAVEGYEQWTDPNRILSLKVDGERNPFYQKLLSSRKSLLIPDTAIEPAWEVFPGTEPLRSCLFVPIVIDGRLIGVVGLGKTEPNYFTEENIQWAEALVGHAAMAMQNAWLFEQVRAGRERLQFLSHRLVEIQETERRYIARELHDQAGQTLTSLILGLGELEKEADKPQIIRARAAELKNMTDGVLEDLHCLAMNLRPVSLDQIGLVSSLDQLIKSIHQDSRLQVRFKTVNMCEEDRLPQTMEIALYRIAQEALTNVMRHARASRVDVVLERRGATVFVLVEDDGKGFDVEQAKISGHLGLLGMEERAEMLGGKLTVESVPGTGTTLVAEVPYDDTNPARG